MAFTEPFVGSPTISTTERSFPAAQNYSTPGVPPTPQTTAGEYYIFIDVVTNMVAGDQFTFTVYDKIAGAGNAAQPVLQPISRTGKQSHQIEIGPIVLKDGWDVSGIRNAGADRVIPFSVRAVTIDVNVASISAAAITATSIASAAITSAKFATDAIDSTALAGSAVTEIQAGLATSAAQTTAQTDLTTLTGRLTSTRAGLLDNLDVATSTRAPSATALTSATWTNTRAGFLDNLNVGGLVASSAEVVAVQNNTRVVRVVPDVVERPDSGTTTFRIEVLLYDSVGNMEVPDTAPTISLVNQAGTDLSARLDSPTMALVSTGRYRAVYTASLADALEQLVWTFSIVEGGATRLYGNTSIIVDTTAVDFTSSDRTLLTTLANDLSTARAVKIDNLDALMTSRAPAVTALSTVTWTNPRAAALDNLDTTVASRASTADVTTVGSAVAAVQADTDNIQTRLPTALDGDGFITASVQSLGAGAITAIAAGVMGTLIETGFTLTGTLRLILAEAVGKLSGVSSGTYRYRNASDTKERIVGQVLPDGRQAITLDPT